MWLATALTLCCGVLGRKYDRLNYNDTLSILQQLDLMNSGVMRLEDAATLTPGRSPACVASGRCSLNPLVKLTAAHNAPAVLLSGTIHGDERLGAPITVYLTQFIVTEYLAQNNYIRWLLTNREIHVLPFANLDGYVEHRRTEQNIDVNRDFPYLTGGCPQSVAGQLLYNLISKQQYVAGITYHGGMRSLTYPWGGPNHVGKHGFVDESPDQAVHLAVAQAMQEAAGIYLPELNLTHLAAEHAVQPAPVGGFWFYPVGSSNGLVYPVKGSVEDWAYAGAWEQGVDKCGPSSASTHLRALILLVETDDSKNPRGDTYGDDFDIRFPTPRSGHIPRNIRMAMRLIEMVRPEAAFTYEMRSISNGFLQHSLLALMAPRVTLTDDFERLDAVLAATVDEEDVNNLLLEADDMRREYLHVEIYFTGCETVQNITVHVGADAVYRDGRMYSQLCSSFGGWSLSRKVARYDVDVVLASHASGPVMVSAVFDQGWRRQISPKPAVAPQTHLAAFRLNQTEPVLFPRKTHRRLKDSTVIKTFYVPAYGLRLHLRCQAALCQVTCAGCRLSVRSPEIAFRYVTEDFFELNLFKIRAEDGSYAGVLPEPLVNPSLFIINFDVDAGPVELRVSANEKLSCFEAQGGAPVDPCPVPLPAPLLTSPPLIVVNMGGFVIWFAALAYGLRWMGKADEAALNSA